MIVGTGIDIIEVARINARISSSNGFRDKVFSKGEISYCEDKPNKGQHYAARFAAKEAFLKAAGEGLTRSMDLFEIEVVPGVNGKPHLELHGKIAEYARQQRWIKIHVSLSHVQEMACAVVIIEQ